VKLRWVNPLSLESRSGESHSTASRSVSHRGRSAIGSITSVVVLICCAAAVAQEAANGTASSSSDASLRELDSQVRELRAIIAEMRAENAQSRTEMRELRQELQDTRTLLSGAAKTPLPLPEAAAPQETAASSFDQLPGDISTRVQKLEESTQLLGSKVDEQYQTKVESAAKYRARLSGIVLMNAFRNTGASDNLDIPDYAQPASAGASQATFGATLRQTEIGLEIFGPTVGGAKTSADIQLDFAGGFPAAPNGVSFGSARLQTGSLRLDWQDTSIVAGQDSLFFSPLSPTSFASLATPAFAYAGNLWGWTPQLRIEHRFALLNDQSVTLQAGVLDNVDWENPGNSFYRTPTAGESSGQPAYALRSAWSKPLLGHPLSFAAAGYYGRQNWSWGRFVDAWAGMTDWQIPLLGHLNLSGEFYRGRAVGGLGAAVGQTIVYGGAPSTPYTALRGLDSAGGWTQLKLQLTPKLELNGTFAEDDAFTANIRGFATDANNFGPILGRNRGALGNIVFRPRSDLLLSAEFRRLHTFPVYDSSSITNQLNLAMGVLF
jgi:hypothetical protein